MRIIGENILPHFLNHVFIVYNEVIDLYLCNPFSIPIHNPYQPDRVPVSDYKPMVLWYSLILL